MTTTVHAQNVARLPAADLHRTRYGVAEALTRCFDLIISWQDRAKQRRQLMEFDDALLKDIGISRADAEREANKPFWR